MPSLKNLARIKDTATGKYLLAVGQTEYSWRTGSFRRESDSHRSNTWSASGTAYKRVHIQKKLREAALVLAWKVWYSDPTHVEPPYPGGRYDSLEHEAYRAARDVISQQVESLLVIPDTWVVEEFVVRAESGAETHAKDWKP